ncbi:hypothetical protein V6N13_072386 [Hibiscus sabdariffa]
MHRQCSGTSVRERKLMPPTIHEELDRRQLLYNLPDETILCPDSIQGMYAQMLCGLIKREEVLRVGVVFAFSLLKAIRFLQVNWKQFAYITTSKWERYTLN